MKFKTEFTVNSHDTDVNGNVRASIMLRYIHEAANLQFCSTHPTLEELRAEQGKAFLLSKVSMSIYRNLHSYEKIEVLTWGNIGTGASFLRSGQIFADGNLVAELISVWALVDLTTRRLCRVRDVQLGFEALAEMPELDMPAHIKFPQDTTLSLMGERTVFYSDIDLNGHMNNTNYPDMLCDFIPDMNKKRVVSFQINYLHEARLGETFKVYADTTSDEAVYIRTIKQDLTSGVEARIVVEDV